MRDYFTNEFKDLLQGLLNKNTKKRFNIHQTKKHPFFKNINWKNFEKKVNLNPPIRPKILKLVKVTNLDKQLLA